MSGGSEPLHVLGVDVGSVSIALAELDAEGTVIHAEQRPHGGKLEDALAAALAGFDLAGIGSVAATASTPLQLRAHQRFNDQICLIAAARRLHPQARSLLVVGGERFGLVRFSPEGDYLSYKANPACAAGTGGFLDQQARRLDLESTRALAALADQNEEPLPRIASRCAVFAKTDLVHAQQEGYSLSAICDGLCRGVARNIVDTLFSGEPVHEPLLLTGGVARNAAVVRHLRDLLALETIVEDRLPMAAVGAALKLLELASPDRKKARACGPSDEPLPPPLPPLSLQWLLDGTRTERSYEHPPLLMELSEYPEQGGKESLLFRGRAAPHSHPVEEDDYRDPPSTGRCPVYLGIDIGSTSTKAVATAPDGEVLAGFYTATAGRPLAAAQVILEALSEWEARKGVHLQILGAGTTGAGRKFIGKILGADLILDEITAHARAAVELHPGVDTIIEIGGQDSKFTILREGRVTLSVMNSVCAAGTGSFIEEQARRLGVPLEAYAEHTEGAASPMANERCTVFMERDLNHYLREGYSRAEVLAAVLHSVRENYLNKVAVEAAIGDHIVFQGATARNRALIAAFEQRLRKPIHVSRFCHLTGALGVALTLRDRGVQDSAFRGIQLHCAHIPVRSEVCELCPNHCKLSVAEVEGETVAYGFLCGRDWNTRRFMRNNTSGFDLAQARRRAFAPGPLTPASTPAAGGRKGATGQAFRERIRACLPGFGPVRTLPEETSSARRRFTVGLPAALHLYEDLPFWRTFFRRLGVRTVTSEGYAEAVREGRLLTGAELCAPMTALHGHVKHLLERADVVFLPFYLEKNAEGESRKKKLCYYTQFAPTLGAEVGGESEKGRVLTPLLHAPYSDLLAKAELYRVLQRVLPGGVSPMEVHRALETAEEERTRAERSLKEVYREASRGSDGFHVVLLGRPYTVLSRWMNKGIPDLFASLGVRVFYQDMLSYSGEDVKRIAPLLEDVHWLYASRILEAAEVVARTPGAYPVLLTSFKCSPDSFITTYVRELWERAGKPYLILELDEHDSRLGYETRIEAAVRAFRNHFEDSRRERRPAKEELPWLRSPATSIGERTLFFPNWDSMSLRLLVAAVRRTGRDARLLELSPGSIRRSLRHNSGQCTPLNIIAQDFMETVRRQDLDPGRTALWIAASNIACNIRLYPHHIRTILKSHGGGFERAEVYAGAMSLQDLGGTLPLEGYLAYMFGGFMRRMGCRIRPYELHRGETDRILEEGIGALERVFEAGGSKEEELARVVSRLRSIPRSEATGRPKVAVFGDLFARDNQVLNQDLIHFIEEHGGEVITTPYTSFLKMVVRPYYWKWFWEGKYLNLLTARAWMAALTRLEKRYFRYFESVLGEPEPAYDASPQEVLAEYNVRLEHTGESMENLLKVFYITRHHPDVALFVQASPAFCCPSLVTEAMAGEIEARTGVPVVSVTYDGTAGAKNDVILPYLEYPRSRRSA